MIIWPGGILVAQERLSDQRCLLSGTERNSHRDLLGSNRINLMSSGDLQLADAGSDMSPKHKGNLISYLEAK